MNLYDSLNDLQRHGVEKMRELEESDIGGGMLTFEPGAGKTLTCISVIVTDPDPGQTLVIVPSDTVAQQWKMEFEKFYNYGNFVHIIPSTTSHGFWTIRPTVFVMRLPILRLLHRYKKAKDEKDQVYTFVHNSNWKRVIFDEGHVAKNPKSRTHLNFREIESNIKWLVTGTPLQNNMKEFRAMVRP